MVLAHPGPISFVQRCGTDYVAVQWGERESADADPKWRGWDQPRSQRQQVYVALWSRMQKMRENEQNIVLEALRSCLQSTRDPLSEPMTVAELKELTEGGLIRLGAHTVTHASLSDLSLEESCRELRDSRAQCCALTDEPADGFAYPYGNLTEEVHAEVGAAKFGWACTTDEYLIDPRHADLFRLPRMTVPNEVGPAFTKCLVHT